MEMPAPGWKTEVIARETKSPCRSGFVITRTALYLDEERSEKGKGMSTMSPGLNIVPAIILGSVPDMGHRSPLGRLQILCPLFFQPVLEFEV